MTSVTPISIDSERITIEQVVAIARDGVPVAATARGAARVKKARDLIARWVAQGEVIYGITTGFGALCNVVIPPKDVRLLQKKILMSHAAGVGRPLPRDVVRAVMAIRLHDLLMGYSGCTMETLDYLIRFLNAGLTPVVPEKGSVGASGDLAPTAHLALV
ncbi:MAG: aromatic amino acid lyase, partial [Desulfobacterales bacterium]